MGAPKKLEKAIYVTTILEQSQLSALKSMASRKHQPVSELIREALAGYLYKERPSTNLGLMGLRGLGKGLWKEDAQKYVDKLRTEWPD